MSTPARQQYLGIKAQHQDALLAYQIGDFFEFFDDDARTVARELQIALTGRAYGPTEHAPLAGVPIHAFETYVTRLVARGYKVAVCEQTSPAGRGLVRREVTRILTPGTVVEPGMLPTTRDNYLVAVAFGRCDPATNQPRSAGLAAVDASTGAFTCVQWSGAALPDALRAELQRLAPAETLAAEPPSLPAPRQRRPAPPSTTTDGDDPSTKGTGPPQGLAPTTGRAPTLAWPGGPAPVPPPLRGRGTRRADEDAERTISLPPRAGEGQPTAAGASAGWGHTTPSASVPHSRAAGEGQADGAATGQGGGLAWLDPFPVTLRPAQDFDAESGYTLLCRQFGVPTLAAFGCEGLPQAIAAAGAILRYLEQMNPALLPMLTGLRTYSTDDFVAIDGGAWRALEVVEAAHAAYWGVGQLRQGAQSPSGADGSRRGGGNGAGGVGGAPRPTTLLSTLDATRTAMGARLLRRTLTQPLRDRLALEARLDAVAELCGDDLARERLGATLDGLGDLERLTARVAQGIAVPRELYALAAGLARAPLAIEALHGAQATALTQQRDAIDPCDEAREFILRAVADPLAGTGRTLQPGFHAALDQLVESVSEARQWIALLEGFERERTGIRSLKVGFNKVFGYYIEVTKPNLSRVPADYQRRQTLATGERYVTADLKEREALVLSAEEQIVALERTLYAEALRELAGYQTRLRATVLALAQLDVWLGLAEVARARRYVRPELTDGTELEIVGGRHPIVEATLDGAEFIPNETRLAAPSAAQDGLRIMLLTGPNMAGKSTYLRQVASIALLAQIGSFVPATSARIGLVDRIFTRVGAEDDLARGLSTFMLEMVETAYILRHATAHSLIVLDEVGRGTSVGDGVAIACAVVEYLHDQVGARTLFATHYEELARLAARLPRLGVFRMAVAERDGQAIFLRRIVPGVSERSYGVQVARMAGLPPSVTARAAALLAQTTPLAALASHPNGAHGATDAQPVPTADGYSALGDDVATDAATPGAALRRRARRIAEGASAYAPATNGDALSSAPTEAAVAALPSPATAHSGMAENGLVVDEPVGRAIASLADLALALASLNIAATTPLDALNLLYALQQRALAMLHDG